LSSSAVGRIAEDYRGEFGSREGCYGTAPEPSPAHVVYNVAVLFHEINALVDEVRSSFLLVILNEVKDPPSNTHLLER
jgi:hypothetical protein